MKINVVELAVTIMILLNKSIGAHSKSNSLKNNEETQIF